MGTAGGSVASTTAQSAAPTVSASAPSQAGATGGAPVPFATRAGTPTSQTYAFRPTTLTLPSGAVTTVDPAGTDSAGVLEVPADPSRVGWWTGGALAGEPFGSVVIAGHVDSRTQGLGVMVELLAAPVGATVVLGDGAQALTYRITSVGAVPKARLASDFEAFRQDVDHRLVLITCGGTYDRAAHSYPDNVVVVAVPVS